MNESRDKWSTTDEIYFFNEMVEDAYKTSKEAALKIMRGYKLGMDARVDFEDINVWELKEYVNRKLRDAEANNLYDKQ